jgi:2-(1,2-epoxy-1,2-dihydrophenyl)acetyl-CoA isomerase
MYNSAEYQNLRISRSDGSLTITLDSTTPYNSLNKELASELLDLTSTAADDESVRTIVIKGTDEVFSAGGALTELSGNESDASSMRIAASILHDALIQLHQSETPILIGVNGPAAGAGFSLALMGDIILIKESAHMKFAYSSIGLTGDGGVTYQLPRLVGLRQAKEIILKDEPICAESAVELGLATEVVSDELFDERLTELTKQLASRPTKAVGATKRLLTESFSRSIEEQMAAETERITSATQTEDYKRGYKAFVEDKDTVTFIGR